MKPIVRIAPSPTGDMHLGTARTALFNYLFAKQNNGKLILRVEDTDRERSRNKYTKNILKSIKWLDLSPDEVIYQSKRRNVYKKYIEELIKNDKAYISKEKAKNGKGEVELVRFKNPNKDVTFNDAIRGEVTNNTTDLGDFIIAKSINDPLFHLAVVVDDGISEITHIIRGEDHLPNTARQILIQEALGFKMPQYVHLPLILSKTGGKLSKRDGALSILEFKKDKFLVDGLINYLASLGWNSKTDKEIFTKDELLEAFRLENIQKSPAHFDNKKLRWVNKKHIQTLSEEEFFSRVYAILGRRYILKSFYKKDVIRKVLPVIKENIETFQDLKPLIKSNYFNFLFNRPKLNIVGLKFKDTDLNIIKKHLIKLIEIINNCSFSSKEDIEKKIFEYANKEGRGEVLSPLRYSLTGLEKSMDPFTASYAIGQKETIQRIKNAIKKL